LEKYLLIVCQARAKLTIKLKHNNQRVENIADDIAEQFAIDWESQGTANLRFALTNLSAEFFQNFSEPGCLASSLQPNSERAEAPPGRSCWCRRTKTRSSSHEAAKESYTKSVWRCCAKYKASCGPQDVDDDKKPYGHRVEQQVNVVHGVDQVQDDHFFNQEDLPTVQLANRVHGLAECVVTFQKISSLDDHKCIVVYIYKSVDFLVQ
jgi:hypothetical protein